MSLRGDPLFASTPCPMDQRSGRKEQQRLSLLQEPKTSRFRSSVGNMHFSSPISKDLFSWNGKLKGSESPLLKKADNVELIRSISQAGWQSKPTKVPQLPILPITEAIHLETFSSDELPVESTGLVDGLGIQMGNSFEVEAVKVHDQEGNFGIHQKEGIVTVTQTVHITTESSPPPEIPDRNASRKLRPSISVTIPETRSLSFKRVKRGEGQHYEKENAPNSSISPTSVPASEDQSPAFRLHVVSPASVQVSRSQSSLPSVSPGVTQVRLTPDPYDKAPSSASSVGNFDDGGSCYSPRSSMSSFHVDEAPDRQASPPCSEVVEFMIMSPTDAGVFDDVSYSPKIHTLRRTKLTLSLLNKKPLPPEPMPEVAPLLVDGKPCSRTSSMSLSHNRSVSDPCQPFSPVSPIPFSSHLALSPVDLDTLDEAFRRSSPLFFNSPILETQEPSPTLDEVTDALKLQLSTISEVPSISWEDVSFEDPLRNRRGPMQMAPTRPAPPAPVTETPPTLASEQPSIQIRRKSISHVVTQMKATDHDSSTKETFPPGLSFGNKMGPMLESILELSPDSAHNKSTESLGSSSTSTATRSEGSIFSKTSSQETARSERALSVELEAIPAKLTDDEILEREEEADQVPELRRNPSRVPRPLSLDLLAPITPSLIPSQEIQESMDQEELDQLISADAAEKVIFNIMSHLGNLSDLFTCAHLNRGFYRTFKRNELTLIKMTLFKMSPAAWELREVSHPFEEGKEDRDGPLLEYTGATYLRLYSRDLCAMVALKTLILQHCSTFLRPETVSALSGNDETRSSRIDDAFWRIWTFCRIFGCGRSREGDIVGQMDWLKGGALAYQHSTEASMVFMDDFGLNSVLFNPPSGFAKGNGKGLSTDELYDMTEIWTCLGALLRGFHGMRTEAWLTGIFDNSDITKGDIDAEDFMLEEWTYHLLTLSPSVVFTLASSFPYPSPNPTLASFTLAKSHGLTHWSAPATGCSRRLFLKEAVARVYESKFLTSSPSSYARSPTRVTSTNVKAHAQDRLLYTGTKSLEQHRRRHTSLLAAELRRTKHQHSKSTPNPIARSPSFASLEVCTPAPPTRAPPPPPLLSPPKPPPYTPKSYPTPQPQIRRKAQVLDPVDKALQTLVSDMGFSDSDAKRALAQTDRGDGLDLNAAIEVLVAEKERRERPRSGMLRRTSGVSERWCTTKGTCERWA